MSANVSPYDLEYAKADNLAERLESAAKWIRGLMRERLGTQPSRNATRRRLERPVVCDVCGLPPEGSRCLNFDHDHANGTFRGWLCAGCNHALGNAKDNPETLRKLADYLERTPAETQH